VKNETILRDFFLFWTSQHPKRSKSARLLQFLNLTTSKTKQFCETSFKNGKLSAALTASYQCVLRYFQLHLSKVLRLPRRSDARSYEVLHLSRKIILTYLNKPTDLMLQNATRLRKSAPWPPNISDEHVFCTAPATRKVSLQILFKCPTMSHVCHRFWKCYKTRTFCSLLRRCTIPCACHAKQHLNAVFLTFWLRNVLRATTACTFRHHNF